MSDKTKATSDQIQALQAGAKRDFKLGIVIMVIGGFFTLVTGNSLEPTIPQMIANGTIGIGALIFTRGLFRKHTATFGK